MTVQTATGIPLDAEFVNRYTESLVNRFFKILPLKESGEATLDTYMRSLQAELLGCENFVLAIKGDPLFLSLLSILQYLIDNPDCSVRTVRREVFGAISICNKLKAHHGVQRNAATEVQDERLG